MSEDPPQVRRLQSSLLNLFLIVSLIGGGCLIYRQLWRSDGSNCALCIGGFLAVLSVATIGLLPEQSSYRRPLTAAVVFAWAFLICLLMAAGPFATMADANYFVTSLLCGVAIAALTGIAARLCL